MAHKLDEPMLSMCFSKRHPKDDEVISQAVKKPWCMEAWRNLKSHLHRSDRMVRLLNTTSKLHYQALTAAKAIGDLRGAKMSLFRV